MKPIFRPFIFLCALLALLAVNGYSQVPVLNSYPAAPATIYLDFDGQYVTGTSWNWGGPINAQPATISLSAINEIFNRVSEDYRPFNINVTTDSTRYDAAPATRRMRVIITATSSWYGNAGGVAYVGSFGWGDNTPSWVFSSLLQNNTKWIAEAASHEAGHTFGLHHQSSFDATCKKTSEYSAGQGEGEIGWAPIMGVGYYKNLTTWHNGPNTAGCNYFQNDIDVIASYTGYKADDHANSTLNATNVSILGTSFNVSGLINKSNDTDAFSIMVPTPTNFKLNAIPENVGSGNDGANIDIRIMILNADADTIGVYNPSTLLSAGIDTNLNSGKYYFIVKGVGNINHSDYGSLGFYSLNGQLANTLPVYQFVLKGRFANGRHLLNWSMITDEPIKQLMVETSADARSFSSLMSLHGDLRTVSFIPLAGSTYYRLKAITQANEKIYYSNVISVQETITASAALIKSVCDKDMTIRNSISTIYRLYDSQGKLLLSDRLMPGLHYIPLDKIQKGFLFLQFDDGGRIWTERLIKL